MRDFLLGIICGLGFGNLIGMAISERLNTETRQKEKEFKKEAKEEAWKRDIEYRLGYVEAIVKRIPIVWKDAKRTTGEEK